MDYSIRDILQENKTARLGIEGRWLTWDDMAGWVVKQQATILYSGTSFTQAVDILEGKV